jgi:hypothetical protein
VAAPRAIRNGAATVVWSDRGAGARTRRVAGLCMHGSHASLVLNLVALIEASKALLDGHWLQNSVMTT